MVEEEIPYGLRRAPLMLVMFFGGGAGFIVWGQTIDEPTFLFPLGRLPPDSARLYLSVVGLACIAYAGFVLYVRLVRRPRVRIGKGEVTLMLGELASRTLTLRRGDVRALHEVRTRGGWRTCHVALAQGEALVHSSHLPNDAAYERICAALRDLIRVEKPKAARDAARSAGEATPGSPS